MAVVDSSVPLPAFDMDQKTLEAVNDNEHRVSIGLENGDFAEHENIVEPIVMLPGEAVQTEPALPPTSTTPSDDSDDSLNDDGSNSQALEAPVPELSTSDDSPSPSQSPDSTKFAPSPSSPILIAMPANTDLPDLTLHSPSSQIVGTPFATDNTRFEYPFPETAAADSALVGAPSPPLSNLFLAAIAQNDSLIPKMGNPFHSNMPPSSLPCTTISSASGISLAGYGLPHGEISVTYNLAHPKLKTNATPPVPPSLAKKSKKWSLNLMGRRKSSSGQSSSSVGTPSLSDFSSNASSPTGSVVRAGLILDGGLASSPPPPSVSAVHGRSR